MESTMNYFKRANTFYEAMSLFWAYISSFDYNTLLYAPYNNDLLDTIR